MAPLGILVGLLVGLAGEVKVREIRIVLIVAACIVAVWLGLAVAGAALSRSANRRLAKSSDQLTLK